MKIALWASDIGFKLQNYADWLSLLESQIRQAHLQKANIFMMPEYVSTLWIQCAGEDIKIHGEKAVTADIAQSLHSEYARLSQQYDMLIISGSAPAHAPHRQPAYTNRCDIFTPEGQHYKHDKLSLTPFEQNPQIFEMSAGQTITLFLWRGYKMAVLICLDIEMPALSVKLASHDLDLILVPAFTVKSAGYYRVSSCARARAVELFCCVAFSGAMGKAIDGTVCAGGSGVFCPSEEEFGHDGILHFMPSQADDAGGSGPLSIIDMPLTQVRKLRNSGAEVWPGAWAADHVEVTDLSDLL